MNPWGLKTAEDLPDLEALLASVEAADFENDAEWTGAVERIVAAFSSERVASELRVSVPTVRRWVCGGLAVLSGL